MISRLATNSYAGAQADLLLDGGIEVDLLALFLEKLDGERIALVALVRPRGRTVCDCEVVDVSVVWLQAVGLEVAQLECAVIGRLGSRFEVQLFSVAGV